MKLKFLSVFTSLCIMAVTFSSCLHGDEGDHEYPSDASITAFSIGNIKTRYTKKINGKDSVLTATVIGKNYPFVIDQLSHLIYNLDSLPYGTSVSRVVTSITSDTNYIVYTKNDKDTVWTSTDSINFESPVMFKVAAYNGTYGTPYRVSVNVHQVNPEQMVWSRLASNFPGNEINAQKAVLFNHRIYVFAEKDKQVEVTSTSVSDGLSWTDLQTVGIPEKADYRSAMAWGNKLYLVAEGNLYASPDGSTWNAVGTAPALSQLVANYDASDDRKLMVAIDRAGTTFVESKDGSTWNETTSIPDDFPKEGLSYTSYPLQTNKNIRRMIVMGKNTDKNYTVTWSRLSTESTWGDNIPNHKDYCPRLENMGMIYYNDSIYAFGGNGVKDTLQIAAFNNFYVSKNQGIDWKVVKENVCFPNEFNAFYAAANGNYSYAVDPNNYLWIMWSNRQDIWRGRINRLGFQK